MRLNPPPLIAVLLLCSGFTFAQVIKPVQIDDNHYRLSLKSGSFIPPKNIADTTIAELNKNIFRPGAKSFVIIQFENIPSAIEKEQLKKEGIVLLDYIPNNAYTATVSGFLNSETISRLRARAIVQLTPQQKMDPSLAGETFPAWAIKLAGTIDVWVSFPKTFSYEMVTSEIKAKNFDILSGDYKNYNILVLRIATNRLSELASLPFIDYVQAAPKEVEPLNNNSTTHSRAKILNSSLPGGRNLRGEDIVVGVGDLANPWQHIDFSGRFINRSQVTGLNLFGDEGHGIHVMGTVGGAGIVRELNTGYAPKSKILVQFFSNILAFAPVYVQDHGMVITNNSYGNPNGCASFGVYDLISRFLDKQAFQLPSLQHVFASGNSGNTTCSPYPAGFSNVLGGYQSSKNTISVGNTDGAGNLYFSSSRGPVRDGRIKPEIVAQGTTISSAYPTNTYKGILGTSQAAPGVSGGLALLYQRYKQLNGGINPKNGLMKALVCNGATDKGNPGPDFSYGFGWMNLLRSVTMLEKINYFNTSVNSGATNTHSISIPAGSSIAQLKVMLYWNDSAAASMAANTLVNDLDLEVTDPSAAIHFPQLLNSNPPNVNDPATTGADHINNIEQVVIDNPAIGNYTFSVRGTTIPSATQHEYFLVFDTIPVSTTLTYPVGGEHLKAADVVSISWDSYGNPANNFTIQYSIDNGTNWTDVAGGTIVASNLRLLSWTVPAIAATSQARVKVIQNGTGLESISEPFTIVGTPAISLAPVQCEGYIAINWTAVTGATDYEVMLLQGEEMVSVATTTANTYTIGGLANDSLYWFSVRARVNSIPGRRADALSRTPNSGTCAGTISDKDLKLDTILGPARSGRKFTSTELSPGQIISIRIENLDDAATVGDIPVSYKIGTNPTISETIIAPNIPARGLYTYSFATTADLSALGSYDIKVSVSNPGDPITRNDTIQKTYKQLDNPFIDLTADFVDNIEAASAKTYKSPQVGLDGLDRYDFVSSNTFGQLRTFVNTGIANSGSKALTLDADRFNSAGTYDTLTATFNLQGYDVMTDDIRLDFNFKHHDQQFSNANKVWIRGDDQKPWIEIYDLYNNQLQAGVYKKASGLELSGLLDLDGQNFSSSFQVRWGQWGQNLVTDNENAAGYTFDDIRLFKVSNDIHLISIDTPVVASCGLDNSVPIRVSVRNTASSTIFSIPITYQIDNNAPVTESISSIPKDVTISYIFTVPADLSALGSHTVKVWVALPEDTYHDNDTAVIVLINSPVITTFPYLQNFESGDGSWHAGGKLSSWQYGTPAATKINGAASGSKAWKTSLIGNHNDLEKSYLYSPCFDITGLANPMLSISIALDLEDCGTTLCDAAYMEYSADGKTWTRLGTSGAGTNWYNKNYSGKHVWSVQNYTRWHVATSALPAGMNRLRLRFVMESDPFVNNEGIAIDDIHIYDSVYGIYSGPPNTSPAITQAIVNGTDWIHFESAGKLFASVNPNGQNMGSTEVQTFINTGAVRVNSSQYYHNRNITIKPTALNLADSATVRFYFLDSETEALINATGCGSCFKPSSAYQLGVTKYSSTNKTLENGTLGDNTGTNYLFITPDKVEIVPFENGYYAEFKVKDFSEFWLNNGGIGNNQALPVELISFTAKKNLNNDIDLDWKTASENNTARFDIELAKGNDAYSSNHFVKIGEVKSAGNSTSEKQYQFTDKEIDKAGVRYYRLKMVDNDGRFTYSEIRAVIIEEEVKWQVYPNPSSGLFNVVYQANVGEKVSIKVHDLNGKLVSQVYPASNAFIQKTTIDLSGLQFASGIYLLEIATSEKIRVFRLLKQ